MMKNRRPTLRIPGQCALLLVLATLLWMCGKDVTPEDPRLSGDVYTVVDQPPTPQGGQAGLSEYMMKNLRYPPEAQRAAIQGTVIVSFVVTDSGRIVDVVVKQPVGGGCDEEAVRVIKGMPNWTPGRLTGKPVNVRTSFPISFTLL